MHRKKMVHRAEGCNELRDIVQFLQCRGRVILTLDTFNNQNDCRVNFLGSYCNVSLLPIRMARLAAVPLIIAIPQLNNRTIEFNQGPQFEFTNYQGDDCCVMKKLISFLETQIKRNPSIWPLYVK